MQGRALLTDRVFQGNRRLSDPHFLRVGTRAIPVGHQNDTSEKRRHFELIADIATLRDRLANRRGAEVQKGISGRFVPLAGLGPFVLWVSGVFHTPLNAMSTPPPKVR
jgi:hypothetical protein